MSVRQVRCDTAQGVGSVCNDHAEQVGGRWGAGGANQYAHPRSSSNPPPHPTHLDGSCRGHHHGHQGVLEAVAVHPHLRVEGRSV